MQEIKQGLDITKPITRKELYDYYQISRHSFEIATRELKEKGIIRKKQHLFYGSCLKEIKRVFEGV